MLKELLHTLIDPDREEREENGRALVARAANVLEVGEFQLLQLAYRAAHGHDLPTALIDRLFTEYMLHNRVPHWADDYARKVLDWNERGLLSHADPAFHVYDRSYVRTAPKGLGRFCVAAAIVFVTIAGGLLVGHVSAENRSSSVLPPFFDKQDLPRASARTPVND